MDGSPRGTKRPYPDICDSGDRRTPEPDPSPLRRYESPPLKMPVPLHTRTAGILRSESPLTGPHLRASSQTPLGRTPAPLSRKASGPPPYTFGSSVSLDPSSLSPIPDPVALAEIKRMVPQLLSTKEGLRNLGGMIEALGADVQCANDTPMPAFKENHTKNSGTIPQDMVMGDFSRTLAGSAFDAFLNDLGGEQYHASGIAAGNNTEAENR